MITIDLKDADVEGALNRAAHALTDMTPLMAAIGNLLVDQTEQRFKEDKSPEGVAWAPRSAHTLKAYERRAKKPGGQQSWGGVLHYSGQLSQNIFSSHGADFASVGSAEPYAAMMQFGGKKSTFANLWGDIPARPFLGLSDANRTDLVDLIADYLTAALEA